MATWVVDAQLTNSTTLTIGATDRIWWNASGGYGSNITVGQFQDTTHVSNSSDVEQCAANHVNNTKWLSSSTVSLNGGGSANVNTITTGQAPFRFRFSDASAVNTSNGLFYAYDGSVDSNVMAGVEFQSFEAGVSSSWDESNGSAAALPLANHSGAAQTQHDFFIAASVKPTSTGSKTGKVKISITYV